MTKEMKQKNNILIINKKRSCKFGRDIQKVGGVGRDTVFGIVIVPANPSRSNC